MSEYKQQLRNPRWQKKRLKILQRDGWRCLWCRDPEKELHVHHTYYTKGRKPWEYPDDDLLTLCSSCHRLIHEAESAAGIVIPWATSEDEEIFEILLFDRSVKRHSDDYPEVWQCRRLNGKYIGTDAGCGYLKMSEGKKGTEWIKWAMDFRDWAIAECNNGR